jgi:indole-3-glycerol phosphate synthase
MKYTDILKERKKALEIRMKYQPLDELKEDIKRVKLRTNFRKSLNKDEDVSIICEYKPASPSLGNISQLMIGDVLPQFEKGGANAVSVLLKNHFSKVISIT